MAVRYLEGDLFSSKAEAWVCPVNVVGIMGAGLALAFKRRLPEVVEAYREACRTKRLQPGGGILVPTDRDEPLYVIMVATKRIPAEASTLEAVQKAVRQIAYLANEHALNTIAVPALGCGCGRLPWAEVKPALMELASLAPAVDFEVYEPR